MEDSHTNHCNKFKMAQTKTVLFSSLNSPGHVNSALGIADELKIKHGLRTVFLILGDPIGNSIKEHGHELVILEEANVYEDYPISDGEDPCKPVDEELMKRRGKTKKKFPGASKWPQAVLRAGDSFKLPPLEAFLATAHLMEGLMACEVRDNHDNYEAAFKSINPDLVIVDAYYVPPCIVNLKHIPWVKLNSANPLGLTKSKLPDGIGPPPTGAQLFTKEERAKIRQEDPSRWQSMLNDWKVAKEKFASTLKMADRPLKKLYEAYECLPLEPGQQTYDSPHLNIYLYPKEIDYDQDDDLFYYKPRWFRANILLRNLLERTNPECFEYWAKKLEEKMINKQEMVYFSLGSIASGDFRLMQRYIDLFKNDTKRLYVISKGVNGDRYDLHSENMIGDNYIPQPFFLSKANLAIIHGGNNSIAECMYFGVPMIVLPLFGDQHDNARRIEDLKLGKSFNGYSCCKDIPGAVDTILANKEIIEKCRKIGEGIRAESDVAKIALMLKKLMLEKHLDQKFIDDCRVKKVEEIQF